MEQTKTLISPLKVLTWCVSDLKVIADRLGDLQYAIDEVESLEEEPEAKLKEYWNLNSDRKLEVKKLYLENYPDLVIRVIALGDDEAEVSHQNLGVSSVQVVSNSAIHHIKTNKGISADLALAFPHFKLEESDLCFVSLHVEDYIDEVEFYTKVLGMSAKLVEEQVFINSAGDGSFCIRLDQYQGEDEIEEVIPRMPHQGWVMMSYETKDVGEILARTHATQNKVYRTPRKLFDPILGEVITMSVLSPGGMVIEVYSKVKS